jgi:riboflavin kinase / FMN adenylyltransferase
VQRWRGLDDVPPGWGPSTVTIGVFDGVHRGHRAIIERAVARARERGTRSVVVTFDPHPSEIVRPGTQPAVLTTLARRAELVEELGVDALLVLPFTPELSRLDPAGFVTKVLVDRLNAADVVVGENFRFGHRAAGTIDTLRELGTAAGFTAEGVGLVGSGKPVSSTRVRDAVAGGDVAAATELLGRPHRVEGVVVHGDHRGRELGFPTANLAAPPLTAVPADGVYAGWLVRGTGERLPTAISVGTNPTFDGAVRRVEAYVLDRTDLDLYDEHVALDLVARLRPTLRFDGVAALVEQMSRDVEQVRGVLAAAGGSPAGW